MSGLQADPASTATRAVPGSGVAAVVVSFNPTPAVADNLAALVGQVDEVVVIDNGSAASCEATLEAVSTVPGVELLLLGENRGIAAALNLGIQVLRDRGYSWIATFDQDSRVTPTFIAALLDAYDRCPFRERVALVSPVYVDEASGMRVSFAERNESGGSYGEVVSTMTSGNLVRVDVHATLGGFDEALFIDYVDVEYCLRCRARGFRLIEAQNAHLRHNLGNPTWRRWMGRTIGTSNHGAMRRYYGGRNRIHVYRSYVVQEPMWVLRDAWVYLKELSKVAIFEEEAGEKLIASGRGVWHGIRGVTGRLEA